MKAFRSIRSEERFFIMRCSAKFLCKIAGYLVLAFGVGVLLTYFLPCSVLVAIEAVIIIASGLVYLLNR